MSLANVFKRLSDLMYFVIAVANANRWKMADIVAIEPSFETVDARLSAAQSRTQVDYYRR